MAIQNHPTFDRFERVTHPLRPRATASQDPVAVGQPLPWRSDAMKMLLQKMLQQNRDDTSSDGNSEYSSEN